MASATSSPVRSRQGLKLSSLHGKRRYPKAQPLDSQFPQFSSDDSISSWLTSSSSADTLPEHTSPTSPKSLRSHNRHRSFTFSRDIPQPLNTRAFWVVLWFFLNFSLTISNKVVLNRFPFPYIITALHALGGCLGTWFVMRPEDRLPTLTSSEVIVLVSFSTLFTLNIVVSNVSLQLVTVPFHQVVRSSAPFFTLLLSAVLIQSRITPLKLISLVPVVAGVGFATYGDYYYTLRGFLLTLLGTILAALKTVVTNLLQAPQASYTHHQTEPTSTTWEKDKDFSSSLHSPHSHFESQRSRIRSLTDQDPNTGTKFILFIPKLHLTPVQLLHLLSPLALFQCILLAIYFGETTKFLSYLYHVTLTPEHAHSAIPGNHTSFKETNVGIDKALNGAGIGFPDSSAGTSAAGATAGLGELSLSAVLGLLINVFMAFALNIVSFHTNRTVGPLGMSVAANVKQVLTILSSVMLFNLTITGMNALGILLTLIGGVWYATVDLRERGVHFR